MGEGRQGLGLGLGVRLRCRIVALLETQGVIVLSTLHFVSSILQLTLLKFYLILPVVLLWTLMSSRQH